MRTYSTSFGTGFAVGGLSGGIEQTFGAVLHASTSDVNAWLDVVVMAVTFLF